MVDWSAFRRPDYSIDLAAVWRSLAVDSKLTDQQCDMACYFLEMAEKYHPIKSRQAASLAIAQANMVVMQMNPAFEALRSAV